MTAGLPGAGIGGLFYLASTILLPLRSLVRRLRGQHVGVPWRLQLHSVLIALGIIGGLWISGWLIAFMVPDEVLTRGSMAGGVNSRAGSILSLATLGVAVGTLVLVVLSVEIARFVHIRSAVREHDRFGHDTL
jgi:hypothetical protein